MATGGGGRRSAGLALLAFVLAAGPAHAQMQLSIGGLAESHGGLETRRTTRRDEPERVDRRLLYGSRYTPTADGFVWNRRFLTYSASGAFADDTVDETERRTELLHTEPYRLQLNVFPEALHSFTLRASQSSYRTDAFSDDAPASTVTTTNRTEGFAWNYRGSPRLPSAGLQYDRTTSATDAFEGLATQTLDTIGLHANKTFERWNPTVRYRLDRREDTGVGAPVAGVAEIGHTFEYSDRIRIGERVYITPTASYQINPVHEGLRSATTVAVPLAGPIDPTLDGSANVRYSLGQGDELTHTMAADGALTKRVTGDLTLSGGVNALTIRGADDTTWSAGGFGNVDAAPVRDLRTVASYALQVSGAEPGQSVAHRGQVSLTSTHVPKHTLTGAYFLNVVDAPGFEDLFVAHAWRVGANSVVLPRTILDAGYSVDVQTGNGRQLGHAAQIGATVTPPVAVALRAALDFSQRATRGGGRAATEETGWGVQAGAEGTPFDWLTVTLSGRRGVQTVKREDRDGDFISDRVTAGATAVWRTFSVQAEAFLDREPVVERSGHGVRGTASYRFRIWTISLDVEQSWYSTVHTRAEQQRVFVRLARPLSHLFTWPWR